jgi:hypothetical protein
MLTAWSVNPNPKGVVLTTNKKALVHLLHTLLPKEMAEIITTKDKQLANTQPKTHSTKMGK